MIGTNRAGMGLPPTALGPIHEKQCFMPPDSNAAIQLFPITNIQKEMET
jgi:hypothetical protein